MSSTDDRIIKMQFDNASFKQKAAETKQSLTDLDKAVESTGKNKGLMALGAGMQRVSLTASKMAVITTTALATITSKAVTAGLQLANSFSFGPIVAGFHLYESELTKLNTIMNATGESQKKVQAALNDLNNYANKTIYSFDDMTTAVTKFTNAGLSLKKSTTLAKNFSNMVAYAGGSAQQASAGMYALTQMMQLGYIQLQDFKQFDNAGLATVKFKQTLIDAAVAQGELTKKGKDYVTKSGTVFNATKSFNNSLQKQWATTKVLDAALGKYNQHAGKMGKDAFESAQKVRTLTAFMSTLKEAMATGWSRVFRNLIGNLQQATDFWTNLSNGAQAGLTVFFKFADATLHTWRTMGGFERTMQGFKNIFAPIGALVKAFADAWRLAFPSTGAGSGEALYKLSDGFARITQPLQILAGWIPKIVPALASFFKIVKLGATDLSAAAHYVTQLVTSMVGLINMKPPSSGGFTSFFDKILHGLSNMYNAGKAAVGNFFDGLIAGFKNGSFDTAANIAGAGLLGAIALYLKRGFKGGLFKFDFGGGISDAIKGSFGQLTDTLKAMQMQLKVKTLMEIATAVGILAASMIALSFINGDALKKSLIAIGVGLGQLLLGMLALSKIGGVGAFIQLPLIAAGMVLLSTAVLILTGAIAAMSALSWESIGKGLAGVAGALVVIALGMKLMPKSLPITGAGLLLVAASLNILVGALALMSTLSWESISKGLAGTAGALVAIGLGMKLMPLSLPITAAGLLLVSIALNAIGTALKIMGSMSWESIGKGLATLAGSMLILAAGLNLMGGTLLGSAAMLVAATAFGILVPSLVIMSKLSWQSIGKGLVALAGGLLILAGGLTLMSGSILGAAALLIVAPAILLLATALTVMAQLSWGDLGKAFVALAGGLAIIGVAGLLIAPVIPALLGLGAALLLMGGGLALAGVGIGAFAAGLAILVGLGAGAIAYLGKFVGAFFKLLGPLGAAFGQFLGSLAKAIGDQASVIVGAFLQMISELISQAGKLLPKLGTLVGTAIKTVISVIKSYVTKMAAAGLDLVLSLLRGLGNKIGAIVNAGANLIVKFIEGVGRADAKVVNAAIDTIIKFINAMATAIRTNGPRLGDAMSNLGIAMIQGLIGGIGAMFGNAMSAIGNLASGMVNKAKGILKIFSPSRVFNDIGKFLVMGLTNGIQSNAASAITAVASMVSGQIATASQYISQFIQDLDQKAIAARAQADGLAAAANKAAQAAKATKGKADDKAAKGLSNRANAASRAADAAEAQAQARKDAQDRADQFASASTIDRAKMRSEDAQNQLDAAKAAEARAAKDLVEANALDKQAKAKGVSAKERKKLEAQAAQLRAQAKADAASANAQLEAARGSAADALAYQKQAGDEAAAAFQAAFDADAKAAADQEAFNKLSDADKAVFRRKQAEDLQAKASKDLNDAKALAYTDLEAANKLADQANNEADQARQYLTEATQLEASAAQGTAGSSVDTGGVNGTVVSLDPTDAAALAMNDYAALYDSAAAAAATTKTVEFNQYNTSPEALSPTEVYRRTNNLLTDAADRLSAAA